MRIDLGPDIEAVRDRTLALIESYAASAASNVRPGTLAVMDAERLAEATRLLDIPEFNPPAGAYPLLELVQGPGSTRDKADRVVALSIETKTALTKIEAQRLSAKALARAATSVAALRAISLPGND
ncbi:hypothetical protein [Roseococcus pinisoli]|uniref:Uncharacterized protein n=1 Tax=Roseococcus pinisoli TaxID=2835040 RepID=A0ABS5QFR1_9PROT|nr:hypothetical protein [Roseococcus pinisoli]MBS7812338.1 hypothetical protein [Roseococcus pinisoli]